jgi:hypothetical protein
MQYDRKQLKNVEYFNYLGSMMTNDERCTREIKSRIAIGKTIFKQKKKKKKKKKKKEKKKKEKRRRRKRRRRYYSSAN